MYRWLKKIIISFYDRKYIIIYRWTTIRDASYFNNNTKNSIHGFWSLPKMYDFFIVSIRFSIIVLHFSKKLKSRMTKRHNPSLYCWKCYLKNQRR